MYVAIFIFGVLLIVLEALASRANRRLAANLAESKCKWLWVYRWRFALGAPLAVASAFVSYPLSGGTDQYQVTGFPFMVMAIDQRGWDYVGFMSIPSLIINGLIWLCLPSLGLWSWARRARVATRAK